MKMKERQSENLVDSFDDGSTEKIEMQRIDHMRLDSDKARDKGRERYTDRESEQIPINRKSIPLSEVKNIMSANIDSVLERGERLDKMIDQSDELRGQAMLFSKRAREVTSYRYRCKLR